MLIFLSDTHLGGELVDGDSKAQFSADAGSINGTSHLLNELAALLHQGRMDGENATQCRVPRSHPDVASVIEKFATFAQDQYNDMATLLSALSTKLRITGTAYVQADSAAQNAMDDILDQGQYVAPENR